MIGDRQQIRQQRMGFTLMETIVALALFSVVVTIAADLFFSFQRVSRRTEALEQVVSASRAIVERIATEAREGTIDYSRYSVPLAESYADLYIVKSNGDSISFISNAGADISITTSAGSESLIPKGVEFLTAAFYIMPKNDPFAFDIGTGTYGDNIQPRVTVFLSLDNGKSTTDRDYTRYDVQTTISSRLYKR